MFQFAKKIVQNSLVWGNESAIDPTFVGIRALSPKYEWINPDPKQGENGGKKDRPYDNNGGSPVLLAHQTLEEGIKMHDDPEGEEELSEERAPRLVAVVDGIRYPSHHPHQVYDEDGGWRDEQRGPLEGIQLAEVLIV